MKFTIERAQLLRTMGHVNSVVEKRNTIPILSNVLIEAAGGRIRMTATDLDIQVVEEVDATVDQEGKTTVQAGTLNDIVRKMPDGSQVQLELDRGQLVVTAGRSRFRLQTLPSDDFPVIAPGDLAEIMEIPAQTLLEAINRTKFAQSTEETRYYLNGIFLHISGDSLRAVATDGHRLARTKVEAEEAPKGLPDMILPRKTVGELAGLLGEVEGTVMISGSETKIRFGIGNVVLTSKLIDGTFPDYQRVIPQSHQVRAVLPVKELVAAVDRVSTIASERTRSVKFAIGRSSTVLSVTSPENGTATDEVACESDGELEIAFNSRYLADALARVEGDNVELHLGDSASPALLKDPAREDDVIVLMPMRF